MKQAAFRAPEVRDELVKKLDGAADLSCELKTLHDLKSHRFGCLLQPPAGPSMKIVRATVLFEHSMSCHQQAAARFQNSKTFGEILARISNMFQHLRSEHRIIDVGKLLRLSIRIQQAVYSGAGRYISTDVFPGMGKQVTVRTASTTIIEQITFYFGGKSFRNGEQIGQVKIIDVPQPWGDAVTQINIVRQPNSKLGRLGRSMKR